MPSWNVEVWEVPAPVAGMPPVQPTRKPGFEVTALTEDKARDEVRKALTALGYVRLQSAPTIRSDGPEGRRFYVVAETPPPPKEPAPAPRELNRPTAPRTTVPRRRP